jgi:molybdenum cofactor biosynthesis enzyme MoaA
MSSNLHIRIAERYDTDLSIVPIFPAKRMKVEVSNYCNHDCIFCGRNKMEKKGGYIDDGFFARIMREAFSEGVREVGLFIKGEPFTDRKLAERIAIVKQIGYEYIYVTTNGSLVSPKRLKSAIDAGLDSIKFSINATNRDDYLKIHGRDDFDKVIENIKYTRRYRDISKMKYNMTLVDLSGYEEY